MATPEQQAEELLKCVAWSLCMDYGEHNSACPAAFRPAVAAALGAKDRDIELLNHDNDLLYAENDRLHELFPKGEPCACNYDERGTVCMVHQVYLDKVAGERITAKEAEIERLKTERDQAITAAAKIAQRRNRNCIKCGDPASDHFGGKCRKCDYCRFGEYEDQVPFELTEHLIAEAAQLRSQLAVATKEAETYKRLYDLRGQALRRGCPKCGYEQEKIVAQVERKG